ALPPSDGGGRSRDAGGGRSGRTTGGGGEPAICLRAPRPAGVRDVARRGGGLARAEGHALHTLNRPETASRVGRTARMSPGERRERRAAAGEAGAANFTERRVQRAVALALSESDVLVLSRRLRRPRHGGRAWQHATRSLSRSDPRRSLGSAT